MREASSLFDSPYVYIFFQRIVGSIWFKGGNAPSNCLQQMRLFIKGIKRGEAPLRNSLPSPLMKGRGIKGEGLVNNLLTKSIS